MHISQNPIAVLRRFLTEVQSQRMQKTSRAHWSLEVLEDRTVPATSIFRTIDGTGNNLTNVEWGSTDSDFLRLAAAEYTDGVSSLAGQDRPSARVISNVIADSAGLDILSDRSLSALIYAWGQFIDHDLDLTNTGTTETLSIAVPTGDPYFDPTSTGTQTISSTRSIFDPLTGTDAGNPRQQVNAITAWLDGSMVYGSDDVTAASLRSFIGGKLLTSAGNLLPMDAAGNFLAGDIRVNENPELTSLQTLFLREHNRLADQIAAANPNLTDEEIYQQARSIVIGEIEAITFNEWLPAVLGNGAISAYQGYDSSVNPNISNEFATAAFRFGHSLLGDDIEFLDNNGNPVADEVALKDAFFNPQLIKENGIDPLIKYLASDPSSELDNKIVDGVRNFLFGPPGSGGLDLASLNIQRGRDHGLADYNTTRAALGLAKVTSFAQISSNPDIQAKLQSLYGNVDNIDLWVGGLAEDHVQGASVGPTIRAIISDQFERLRDGDRLWYQNVLTGSTLQQVQNTKLSDVIARNTTTTNLQQNVFFFRVGISGFVFEDNNRDGTAQQPERRLAGRTIQLVSVSDNSVVATTMTDAQGAYNFSVQNGLGLGSYRVQEVLPNGRGLSAQPTNSFVLTRGETFFNNANFGEFSTNVGPGLNTINGNETDDVFLVLPGQAPGSVIVRLNGQDLGPFQTSPNAPLRLFGMGGNDNFSVAPGLTIPVSIEGGAGNDTIAGGQGNDSLRGNDGNDLIFGLGGNDLINCDNGDDSADGGDGADSMDGGNGADLMFGSAGADLLFGFAGNDALDGGADNDSVDGGSENDYIVGGSGNDLLFGLGGNDSIDGGAGNDQIDGGDNDDVLFGTSGNDILFGGNGNDRMDAGEGDDRLDGGLGDDLVLGSSGNDLMFGGAGNDSMDGNDGRDSLDGGDGNDLMFGSGDADSMAGGNGDDSMDGRDGSDTIRGDAGNDFLYGGPGQDFLDGGSGQNFLDPGRDNGGIGNGPN